MEGNFQDDIINITFTYDGVKGFGKHEAMPLTLLGLGLIKINTVSDNFNNPRPSLILNN